MTNQSQPDGLPSLADLPSLPLLDVPFLHSIVDQLPGDVVTRLLDKFVPNASDFAAAITRAEAAHNPTAMKNAAHGLKGLCLQFGAMRLGHMARHLEAAAREERPFGTLPQEIGPVLADTLGAITAWRAAQGR